MNETFIENKKAEIIDLIKNKASGNKIYSIISEAYRKGIELSKFSDFVADIFLIDPDFFMKNISKTYNKNITRLLNSKQLIEMEEAILKKHCLYQDEKILVSFYGFIGMSRGSVRGRIYLTNYRFIAQGVVYTKGNITGVLNLKRRINKAIYKSINKMIQKIINQTIGAELPCFGIQYPSFGVERLKNVGKKVNYTVRIKSVSGNFYEKYKFVIRVDQYPEERQSDFDTRANEVTNLISNTIIDTSKKFEE
jgi:hypothetical protein